MLSITETSSKKEDVALCFLADFFSPVVFLMIGGSIYSVVPDRIALVAKYYKWSKHNCSIHKSF